MEAPVFPEEFLKGSSGTINPPSQLRTNPDMKVWKMFIDYGRSGSLDSIFAATNDDIKNLIGKTYHVDEPFGKHSEAYGKFAEEDFRIHTSDPLAVYIFEAYGFMSGYIPYDILSGEDEEC